VILLPWRGSWSNTNVALLLVVVVVAVAAVGNRAAGTLAALGAAAWFDFFFTVPYQRFTIRSRLTEGPSWTWERRIDAPFTAKPPRSEGHGTERGIVPKMKVDVPVRRTVWVQHRPAWAARGSVFVMTFPRELDARAGDQAQSAQAWLAPYGGSLP
jgi:Domain of unknown function (DUF4118)